MSQPVKQYLVRIPSGRTAWFAPDAASLADGDSATDAAHYAAFRAHGAGCSVVLEYGKPVTRSA